ncbi:MAG: diguanylate cyclase domain-containing protein [Nocardioides sp.]
MVPTNEGTRIRSLAATARALGGSEALFPMLEIAAEEIRRTIDAASVSVSRVELGTMRVRTIVNVGDLGPREERWPQDETYGLDEYVGMDVIRGLESWTGDLEDPDCNANERALLLEVEKGSSLGAPLMVDGQLWGEVWSTRHVGDRRFDDVDEAYVEALIAILAGAISRSMREESLEQLAYQDPLTGLANRRALDERATQAFDVAPGASRTLTVVTVDINRLKELNDTAGHVAGDQLIQSVAKALLKAFTRLPGSLVARVGGDEFSVMVSGHDPAEVVSVADELCARTWRFGPGTGVSCGAATAVITAGTAWTAHDLFAAADRAQYVAKHGRLSSTVVTDLDDVLAER